MLLENSVTSADLDLLSTQKKSANRSQKRVQFESDIAVPPKRRAILQKIGTSIGAVFKKVERLQDDGSHAEYSQDTSQSSLSQLSQDMSQSSLSQGQHEYLELLHKKENLLNGSKEVSKRSEEDKTLLKKIYRRMGKLSRRIDVEHLMKRKVAKPDRERKQEQRKRMAQGMDMRDAARYDIILFYGYLFNYFFISLLLSQ